MYHCYILVIGIALIAMQSMVFAHFTLTYPSSRGFSEDQESVAPCGGFNTASAQRVILPLQNAFIEINSGHTSYSYQINAISGNDTVQVGQGSRGYPQASCLPIQLNSTFKDGTNTTLQVVYNGGDGLLYQCVDVTFANSAPSFNSSACANQDGSKTSFGNSSTPSPSSSGNQSSNGTSSLSVGVFTFMAVLFTFLLA